MAPDAPRPVAAARVPPAPPAPRDPEGAPAAPPARGRPGWPQGKRNVRLGGSAPASIGSARPPRDPRGSGRTERTGGAARPETVQAPVPVPVPASARLGVRCAPGPARPRGVGARRPGPPPATWTGPGAGSRATRDRARAGRSATRTRRRARRSSSPGRAGADAARSRPWWWPVRVARRPPDAPKERQREQERARRAKPPDAQPAWTRPARAGRAAGAGPWHPLARSRSPRAPAASAHPNAWSPNRRRAPAAATRTTSPRRRRRPSPCRPGGRPARPEGWSDPATRDASGVAQAANGPGCLAWIRRARGGTRARGGFRLGVGGRGMRHRDARPLPRSRIGKA